MFAYYALFGIAASIVVWLIVSRRAGTSSGASVLSAGVFGAGLLVLVFVASRGGFGRPVSATRTLSETQLTEQLAGTDHERATSALVELRRRDRARPLPREVVDRIIETGLQQQALSPADPAASQPLCRMAIRALCDRLVRGELTDAQRERLGRQALHGFRIRTRSRIRSGGRARVESYFSVRLSGELHALLGEPRILCGDAVLSSSASAADAREFHGASPLVIDQCALFCTVDRPAGPEVLRWIQPFDIRTKEQLVYQGEVVAEQPIQVIWDAGEPELDLVSYFTLDRAMSERIRVRCEPPPDLPPGAAQAERQRPTLRVQMTDDLPANAYMLVVGEFDGRTERIGVVQAASQPVGSRYSRAWDFSPKRCPQAVLLLPHIPGALTNTCFDTLWNRGLLFENITASHAQASGDRRGAGVAGELIAP